MLLFPVRVEDAEVDRVPAVSIGIAAACAAAFLLTWVVPKNPDGMRADVTGNLWCSSNAPLGYAGVLVFTPAGKLIGRIRLPEVCANLCFGGSKRDRLFMTASQSLYMLQVATQGAAPG